MDGWPSWFVRWCGGRRLRRGPGTGPPGGRPRREVRGPARGGRLREDVGAGPASGGDGAGTRRRGPGAAAGGAWGPWFDPWCGRWCGRPRVGSDGAGSGRRNAAATGHRVELLVVVGLSRPRARRRDPAGAEVCAEDRSHHRSPPGVVVIVSRAPVGVRPSRVRGTVHHAEGTAKGWLRPRPPTARPSAGRITRWPRGSGRRPAARPTRDEARAGARARSASHPPRRSVPRR